MVMMDAVGRLGGGRCCLGSGEAEFGGCCPALKMPMKAALAVPMWGC
jgi:hypothetical protein